MNSKGENRYAYACCSSRACVVVWKIVFYVRSHRGFFARVACAMLVVFCSAPRNDACSFPFLGGLFKGKGNQIIV